METGKTSIALCGFMASGKSALGRRLAAALGYDFVDTDELLLGDIMISAERAAAQAKEYGHSVKREFCFLVAHSMLHLLGYDHMEPDEAAVMEAKQAKALEDLGITR